MSNSWYDTLTSTPALIATALGVSVTALFVSTRNSNSSSSSNSAAQIKEQVKEVAQSVHAEGSKGKMAQAVRDDQWLWTGLIHVRRVLRSCPLLQQTSLLPR